MRNDVLLISSLIPLSAAAIPRAPSFSAGALRSPSRSSSQRSGGFFSPRTADVSACAQPSSPRCHLRSLQVLSLRAHSLSSSVCMQIGNMAEEESKPLNFIPEVILKKRKSNEAWALRKKAQLERSNFGSNKNKDATIKSPEDFVIQYRSMELDLIRMKRRVKRKLPQLNSDSKPLIVIRIHGKNDMHPKTRKNLYSLGLRRVFSAVFLKPSDGVLAKLQRVEPFVTYGYPNLKSIKELIYKKGHMKIEKRKVPLTDNNIIEQELGKYGIVCMEDMVHQIYNVGPHFKEVIRLMWPFELNKPVGGLTGSKTLFKDGGDSGNREDLINELVSKMN